MSDGELVELYRQGPSAFVSPDVWQMLDAECHRRHLKTEAEAQEGSEAETDAEDTLIAQSLMQSPDAVRVPAEECLQLLRVHIGPNWKEHYKAAFLHFSEGGDKLHWNHAATLVRVWLWYRRLYPVAIRMAYVRSEGGVRYTFYWLCGAAFVILKIEVRSFYAAA